MKAKDGIILTRPFYCEECFKQKRPQRGQRYVTVGSTHKTMHVHSVQEGGSLGFVPTLLFLEKVEKGFAYFYTICGMDECGVSIDKEPNDRGRFNIAYSQQHYHRLPLKEWNQLVLATDLGYHLGI